MKKKIFISLAVLLGLWIGYRLYRLSTGLTRSPSETVHYSFQDTDVAVTYSRPYKKGREIFGKAEQRWWLPNGQRWALALRLATGMANTTGALVPDGRYWRLGANNATEISFSKNVIFGDKPVNGGKYRMYAIPNAQTWRVTLNSELGKFGYNEPDYSKDVVTVEVPVETTPTEAEQFTINFENDSSEVKMNFKWDKTVVRVPLKTR